jgi:hypothetical protein
MRTLIVVAIGSVALIQPAAAQLQAPTAIVEEVKGNVQGAEFMDYVHPGKVIKLGVSGVIVLNYLTSCLRETITGGVVLVGTEHSKVDPMAEVASAKVDCDARQPQLSDSEASQSAATTFRSMDAKKQGAAGPKPTKIYGLSPVFETAQSGKLVIERTDIVGTRDEVTLDAKTMVKGKFYDMAKAGKSLTPGASYAASIGARKIAFTVDPNAQPGAAPIVGRLLRL